MKEIDDKIDYEPGPPERLSFLKALAFLILSSLSLLFGIFIGGSAGWLVAVCFLYISNGNFEMRDDQLNIVAGYWFLSSLSGFLLTAYFLIPRLYRKFYSW